MIAAAWTILVATLYAILYTAAPEAANATVIFFVGAVLGPAFVFEHRHRR